MDITYTEVCKDKKWRLLRIDPQDDAVDQVGSESTVAPPKSIVGKSDKKWQGKVFGPRRADSVIELPPEPKPFRLRSRTQRPK